MFVRLVTFSKYASEPLIVQAVYEDVKQLFSGKKKTWLLLTRLQSHIGCFQPLQRTWSRDGHSRSKKT